MIKKSSESFVFDQMDRFKQTCQEISNTLGVHLWPFVLSERCAYYFSPQQKFFRQPLERPGGKEIDKEWVACAMRKKGTLSVLYEEKDIIIYIGTTGDTLESAKELFNLHTGKGIIETPEFFDIRMGMNHDDKSISKPPEEITPMETRCSITKTSTYEMVTLVKDYGPQSHALFDVSEFLGKELAYYSALRSIPLFSYNPSLTFQGQKRVGWIIRCKSALPEVMNLLKSLNITVIDSSKN